MKSTHPIALLSIVLLCLCAQNAHAATIVVDSVDCLLHHAIDAANADSAVDGSACAPGSGDDIIQLIADVPESTPRIVSSPITLDGQGYTIDADNKSSLIHVHSGDLDIKNAILTGGRSTHPIQIYYGGLTLENTTIKDNVATGFALLHSVWGSKLTVIDSVFENNRAAETDARGAAIYYSNPLQPLRIEGSVFKGNRSATCGAIYINASSSVTITDTVFRDNVAEVGDGGAFCVNYHNRNRVHISESVFLSNSAAGRGGAILHRSTQGSILSIENSSILNNSAGSGGGIYNLHKLALKHVTLYGNTASGCEGGGLANAASGAVEISNSIIAGGSGSDCHNSGAIDTNAGNLIQDGSCSPKLSGDPMLGNRVNSALPYRPLQTGSPAIGAGDAGQCLASDQLGFTRETPCDIGAVEYAPTASQHAAQRKGNGKNPDKVWKQPAPVPTPTPVCTGKQLGKQMGVRVKARYGICSGVQFQRVPKAALGHHAVMNGDFRDALDVWAYVEQGVEVCFPGHGRLVLLDAATSPRRLEPLDAFMRDGMTCAQIAKPGTLVLLAPDAGIAPPARPESPKPAKTPNAVALRNCMARLDYRLNFRKTPAGEIMRELPKNILLTAFQKTRRWVEVDFHGQRGWLSLRHVTLQGDC